MDRQMTPDSTLSHPDARLDESQIGPSCSSSSSGSFADHKKKAKKLCCSVSGENGRDVDYEKVFRNSSSSSSS
jgi:hypothetical protein